MPTLSSLVVQRQLASMRTVEDALTHQVVHGGDLPTRLLELDVLDEPTLTGLLAETSALEVAPPGSLPPPSDEVLRVFPGELGLKHNIYPLSLEGRTLRVAVTEPIPASVEEDLGFALDVDIVAVLTTLVRVREGLAGFFGVPMDRRLLRLLAKLEGRSDPSPSAPPPPLQGPGAVHLPRPASAPPPAFGRRLRSRPARTPTLSTLAPLSPLPPPVSDEPPRAAPTPVVLPPAEPHPEVRVPAPPAPPVIVSPAPSPARSPSPTPTPTSATEALTALARRGTEPPSPTGRRERPTGPFSRAEAEVELDEVQSTEAALWVYFDFAQQYFEYAALFTVKDGAAIGRDASGPGLPASTIEGLSLPLEPRSALGLAHSRSAPIVSSFTMPPDVELLVGLGRSSVSDQPTERAVIPLMVRGRAVALLYGDAGRDDVSLGSLGELIALTGLAGKAIERVIVERKLGRRPMLRPPPAPRHFDEVAGISPTAMSQRVPDLGAHFEPIAIPSEPPPPRVPPASSAPPVAAQPASAPPAAATGRRGTAPALLPRAPASSTFMGEPLPAEPPPNATSHGDVPEPGHGPKRRSLPPPIPREEVDEGAFSSGRASNPPGAETTDLASELREWLRAYEAGGPGSEVAFTELARRPSMVIPLIASRFPGPLRVDRHRLRGDLPPAAECGPLLALYVSGGRASLPHVTVRSTASDVESRLWATHVLGELRYVESASAVLVRLFDEDRSVRRVARRSAISLLQTDADSAEIGSRIEHGLGDIASDPSEPTDRRTLAIETMGELREPRMVPRLIDMLADASAGIAEASRRALSLITRQDFERDASRWTIWWEAHQSEHRIAWLIDALTHPVDGIRRASGDELKQLTKEYFGYYDDLPRRERERAQARYREWWDKESASWGSVASRRGDP